MADVFISYSREDRMQAEHVARGLQAIGLDVFWDQEIPPGRTWADFIEEKLANSKAMIVLWSANSANSQWVREEARMGRDKGRLIPVMLDGTPAPFGFGEVQAANLATWRGETNHPDWVRFANAVDSAVRGANAQPRPIPQAAPQAAAAGWNASASAAPAEAESLSPPGYVLRCLRKFFDGKGRARRLEYGSFAVLLLLVLIAGVAIDIQVFGVNAYTGEANSYVFTGLAYLVLYAPLISASSRRAHDFGQSGWLAILVAIPSFGLLAALILIFIPGQRGPNKYGPDPKGG